MPKRTKSEAWVLWHSTLTGTISSSVSPFEVGRLVAQPLHDLATSSSVGSAALDHLISQRSTVATRPSSSFTSMTPRTSLSCYPRMVSDDGCDATSRSYVAPLPAKTLPERREWRGIQRRCSSRAGGHGPRRRAGRRPVACERRCASRARGRRFETRRAHATSGLAPGPPRPRGVIRGSKRPLLFARASCAVRKPPSYGCPLPNVARDPGDPLPLAP